MEQNVQNLSSWQGTSGRCLTYSMFTAVPRMEIYCWDMHLVCFFEENNLHWSELWYLDCLFVLTANSSFACSWCTPFIVWSREIFVNVSVKKPYGPCDEIASEIQKSIFVNRFSSTVWIGLRVPKKTYAPSPKNVPWNVRSYKYMKIGQFKAPSRENKQRRWPSERTVLRKLSRFESRSLLFWSKS